MGSRGTYQLVKDGGGSHIADHDKNTDGSFSNEADDSKLGPVDTPPNHIRRSRRPWDRVCLCSDLSRSTIVTCALTIIVTVSAVLGGGGYWAYRANLIDNQSPAWYPTPRGGTVQPWAESYRKAQAMVSQMTLVEKVNVTTGTGWAMDLCVGGTGMVDRLGFPALCLQDGPLGIRFSDHADAFPAGITVGSTWNRHLMRQRGEQHGREARMKNIHVLLGPAMGPLGRNPAGGRAWEGFAADPMLQAVGSAETIRGIQSQGVQATAKHYVGNEQEHFRKSFEWGIPEALSSNIDDRALHEIYAWPFAESVRAGVASVMCAYQMVNNSYACQNSKLLNGVLKDELGFQGYVQSDWLAQRSGVASALAGLDMSMPGDGLYWEDGNALFGEHLTIAVLNGSVPMERLNDMVTRIVAAWYQLGQDAWEDNIPNFSSWTDKETGKWHNAASNSKAVGKVNKFVDTMTAESRAVARSVAAEGTVLLKNDGVLPLTRDFSHQSLERTANVMIVGEDAGPAPGGPNKCPDRACNEGTLAVGWGSGATEFPYLIDPLLALNRSFDHSKVVVSSILTNQLSKDHIQSLQRQDLCMVFVNADAGEGYLAWNGVRADRNDLELQKGGATLVETVAESCGGDTIVVIHAVGPVIVESFADKDKVKAIVLANLPGQESGNALADVIFGDVDASGRLAYTMGRSLADYGDGAPVLYYPNHIVPQVDFREGLYIDYRHFDKYNIEPRYPFGHGLSYTVFTYRNLQVKALREKSSLPPARGAMLPAPSYENTIPPVESTLFPRGFYKLKKYIYPWLTSTKKVQAGVYPYPAGYHNKQEPSAAGGAEGGNPSLFEEFVAVSFDLTNIGRRPGQEVVQLYVSYPDDIRDSVDGAIIDTPPQMLRNFTKIELQPGQSERIELTVSRKDLSYWSVTQQNWVMPTNGEFKLAVGRSSRDIKLSGPY